MKIKVSIIIVTWNNEDIIRRCVESIRHICETIEVIVVDNNSSDRTLEIVKASCPDAILIENTRNEGYAKANNEALAISKGEYLLLLNSDAILLEGSIDKLLEFMAYKSSAGVVGPQLVYPDGSLQRSYGNFPSIFRQLINLIITNSNFEKFKIMRNKHYPNKSCNVDYIEGACMLIRRGVIDDIGNFDESFYFYGEDADLCYRAKRCGWEITFVPESKVIHLRGASSTKKDRNRYTFPLIKAQAYFVRKHNGLIYAFVWKITYILSMIPVLLFNIVKYFFLAIIGNRQKEVKIKGRIFSLLELVTFLMARKKNYLE